MYLFNKVIFLVLLLVLIFAQPPSVKASQTYNRATAVWVDYGHVVYYAHVQNIGWMGPFYDGQVAGTVGQSLRVEAVMIEVSD